MPKRAGESENSPLAVMLCGSMAGGLGWGIRGQYGHETGAMIAGVLTGLALALCLARHLAPIQAARSVALMALGISFGGSMTYGQTLGLTHDSPLVGNDAALLWGMLGLGLKGGTWIGFAGLFFGVGLSQTNYRFKEVLLMFLFAIGMLFLGVQLLNQPFHPGDLQLPRFYFSDDWRWEPDAELRPRRERWGGLLLALLACWGYLGFFKKDRLAMKLGGWGFLAGAIGFPGGQCIQAFHAWNTELVKSVIPIGLYGNINWWNMMETTFGCIFGAVLGLGLYLNRHLIVPKSNEGASQGFAPVVDVLLILVHVMLLGLWNFGSFDWLDSVADLALTMGLIPTLCLLRGRFSPYLMILPVVAFPIAGKTLLDLSYKSEEVSMGVGWTLYLVLPLVVASVAAFHAAWRAEVSSTTGNTLAGMLLLTTWGYFGLNYAFFRFPWPWAAWTSRTPNSLIFLIFAIGLSVLSLQHLNRQTRSSGTRE
jgi:hypothetical protein